MYRFVSGATRPAFCRRSAGFHPNVASPIPVTFVVVALSLLHCTYRPYTGALFPVCRPRSSRLISLKSLGISWAATRLGWCSLVCMAVALRPGYAAGLLLVSVVVCVYELLFYHSVFTRLQQLAPADVIHLRRPRRPLPALTPLATLWFCWPSRLLFLSTGTS